MTPIQPTRARLSRSSGQITRTRPAPNKAQPTGHTHIGAGEISIKKSNSEPRQNRTGILASDSSTPNLRFNAALRTP
ncbi:hypothetical protein B9Z19DRAFT_1123122 [Tuber borchii]|uniref:Uncharacterized protein n=1 Tax=Tuber borchii TaxID=42251 RepID=A0A2T6ZZ33_TUBBO|nr:hypothetical protein B9Z19DRAFT_1123122 [Tuber borchii]